MTEKELLGAELRIIKDGYKSILYSYDNTDDIISQKKSYAPIETGYTIFIESSFTPESGPFKGKNFFKLVITTDKGVRICTYWGVDGIIRYLDEGIARVISTQPQEVYIPKGRKLAPWLIGGALVIGAIVLFKNKN